MFNEMSASYGKNAVYVSFTRFRTDNPQGCPRNLNTDNFKLIRELKAFRVRIYLPKTPHQLTPGFLETLSLTATFNNQ